MERCESCLDSRCVVSENGFHYCCCLKEEEAMECLLGKVDHYIKNPMRAGAEDVFTRKEELTEEESEWLIDFITKEGGAE